MKLVERKRKTMDALKNKILKQKQEKLAISLYGYNEEVCLGKFVNVTPDGSPEHTPFRMDEIKERAEGQMEEKKLSNMSYAAGKSILGAPNARDWKDEGCNI